MNKKDRDHTYSVTLSQAAENFCEAEDFFDVLRASFKASSHVNFYATYPVKEDPLISPKQHVTMAVQEIWRLTGYRFT